MIRKELVMVRFDSVFNYERICTLIKSIKIISSSVKYRWVFEIHKEEYGGGRKLGSTK